MGFFEDIEERLNHQLKMKMKKPLVLIILLCSIAFGHIYAQNVTVGAARISSYLPLLKGHKVGLFSNKSGRVNGKLTLDLLLENKVNVIAIFSPEHV